MSKFFGKKKPKKGDEEEKTPFGGGRDSELSARASEASS
tara:strand:+ start:101 stop:217 length:117 start_codon:yes stop_codon:yes gene_type:complete